MTYIAPEDRVKAIGAKVYHFEPHGDGARCSFTRTSTNALMAKAFKPIQWILGGYVPEGFSVLAGRQKLGKTRLAFDWAVAVATGGAAMGSIMVEQGDVIYLDLENGERRIQRNILTIFPDERTRPDLCRLEFVTGAPQLDKGFIDALDDWRVSVAKPRLVVIDVLQRIKPPGIPSRNSYENDYSIWSPLQRWATEYGIGVLGLHHTRKGGADDPLEALSGSNGLSACADTTLVLDRDGNGITLYVRGRDVEEIESALDFTGGLWTLKGDAAKVRMTRERHAILDALMDATEPVSPAQIADATSMSRQNVRQLLVSMGKAGEIRKAGRALYAHPDTPDHKDHKITTGTKSPENRGPVVVMDAIGPSILDHNDRIVATTAENSENKSPGQRQTEDCDLVIDMIDPNVETDLTDADIPNSSHDLGRPMRPSG